MKMIIGTCGFSWSGSSAAADFLAEFDENLVYNDDEFIIAFFPDGIEDLDFNLNYKCAKFISSTVAIPRFKRVAHDLLFKPTNGQIDRITESYLDSLIQVKWLGKGQGQSLLHNRFVYENIAQKLTLRLLNRIPESFARKIKFYPLGDMMYSICPDSFVEKTQDYTDEILRAIGLDLSKNIVLDQPFAGNNPINSMKYYRDSRCIIVDRDPRDLYMLAKEYFPRRSYQVPHDNVDDFINYFYHMHKNLDKICRNKNVLYIKFEDLVYDYDNTGRNIIDFLGLGEHKNRKKYFKPERSMANTRLFKKCRKYDADIKEIEIKLSEFLFNFEKYGEQHAVGEMFDENPPIDWKKQHK